MCTEFVWLLAPTLPYSLDTFFLYQKTGKIEDKATSLGLLMKAAMVIANWDGNTKIFHGGNWQMSIKVMIIQQNKSNGNIWQWKCLQGL